MIEKPTFFFSHARQDREMRGSYLRTFFEDLESRVAQWAGINISELRQRNERLGTIDERIVQSDDWDQTLSESLRDDQVFIAILTPVFFAGRTVERNCLYLYCEAKG
jgi:hypothetical protein